MQESQWQLPTETDKAWLAGFVDGEGSLFIHAHPNSGYQARIAIYQTSDIPLKEIQEWYGGSLYVTQLPTLGIFARKAVQRLLEDILPHLRVKHVQACWLLCLLKCKDLMDAGLMSRLEGEIRMTGYKQRVGELQNYKQKREVSNAS